MYMKLVDQNVSRNYEMELCMLAFRVPVSLKLLSYCHIMYITTNLHILCCIFNSVSQD